MVAALPIFRFPSFPDCRSYVATPVALCPSSAACCLDNKTKIENAQQFPFFRILPLLSCYYVPIADVVPIVPSVSRVYLLE